MKLFIFAIVLIYVSHISAYPDACSKGPEYWCRDSATAVDCGALRHCQQTVWFGKTENSRSLPTVSNTHIFCDDLAAASQKLINQGVNHLNTIKASLRDECSKITDLKYMVPYCKDAVESFTDNIIFHIQNGVETSKICSNILNSDSSKVPDVSYTGILNVKSAECTFCKFLIGYLDSQLQNNRTPAAIEAELEKICNVLPASLKDNCTSLVKKFGPIIAFMLSTNATPIQVCNFIKFCNNGTEIMTGSVKNLFPTKSSTFNIPQCSVCKFVINYAETLVETTVSESDSVSALSVACDVFPTAVKNKCNRLVESIGVRVMQGVRKFGKAEVDCTAMKLC